MKCELFMDLQAHWCETVKRWISEVKFCRQAEILPIEKFTSEMVVLWEEHNEETKIINLS